MLRMWSTQQYRGGVVSINGPAIGLWKKLRVSMVGTLPKAFCHKRLRYIAYVMYQLLQNSHY
jgi:hypothetical protein